MAMNQMRLDELTSDELMEYLEKVSAEQLLSERREEIKEYSQNAKSTGNPYPPNIVVRCKDDINVQLPITHDCVADT